MAIPLIELWKFHTYRHRWIIELNGPAMLIAAVELISVFVLVIHNIMPVPRIKEQSWWKLSEWRLGGMNTSI